MKWNIVLSNIFGLRPLGFAVPLLGCSRLLPVME